MSDAAPPERVAVRFLVVRDMPLVAVDVLHVAGERPALLAGGLFQAAAEAGLAPLPAFLGVDLPRGAQLGWTLEPDRLVLQDDRGGGLLDLPRAAVDDEWCRHALRLRGTIFVLGRGLGLAPDDGAGSVAATIDAAARDGRLLGAIVGVAEATPLLPIFG